MSIPPRYTLTPAISQLLLSIERSKAIIETYPLATEIEANIRRESTLKSSLFSARIEGNTTTLEELHTSSSRTQKKREIFNILNALNVLRRQKSKQLLLSDIRTLHQLTLKNLAPDAGTFRTEMSAIFNTAGVAIYVAPTPHDMMPLLEKLIRFANSKEEQSIPIRAALVHFAFEKIHPFLDGNGRVGRLLVQKILMHHGYAMKGLLSLEEYLDTNRSEYYRMLELPENNVTAYIDFMLQAIDETAKKATAHIMQKHHFDESSSLLPRRAEILSIIQDHQLVNFDQIKRRFRLVNARTLRYDLKKLQEKGFIRKRGTTRGVYYERLND